MTRPAMFRRVWHALLDLLYPPSCLSCGADVTQAGLLCGPCLVQSQPVAQPFCRTCATPQVSQAMLGDGGCCPACERHPPLWGQARAAFVYTPVIRSLVLQLKYADRLENAAFLGQRMAHAGADMLRPGVLLVPVPVHRWRLLRRGYNQAALLAAHIARRGGFEHVPDALVRQRATASLARFSREARRVEVDHAMTVRATRRNQIAGRHVVLVDDLLTTGATATACVAALQQAGAARVDLLVAAVVPAREEVDISLLDMPKPASHM